MANPERIEPHVHQTDPTAGLRAPLAILAGVMALLLVGMLVLGVRVPGDRHDPVAGGMLDVAPGGVVDPADVPAALAVHYHAAGTHPDVFSAVPCFCGCEDFLGHRHLLDCFLRPDGSGWEAHALGCGVCLGEAAQVEALLAAGEDVERIRAAVVAQWGDPYARRS